MWSGGCGPGGGAPRQTVANFLDRPLQKVQKAIKIFPAGAGKTAGGLRVRFLPRFSLLLPFLIFLFSPFFELFLSILAPPQPAASRRVEHERFEKWVGESGRTLHQNYCASTRKRRPPSVTDNGIGVFPHPWATGAALIMYEFQADERYVNMSRSMAESVLTGQDQYPEGFEIPEYVGGF